MLDYNKLSHVFSTCAWKHVSDMLVTGSEGKKLQFVAFAVFYDVNTTIASFKQPT